jgi:DASS family divalent anion:Na+ symporter
MNKPAPSQTSDRLSYVVNSPASKLLFLVALGILVGFAFPSPFSIPRQDWREFVLFLVTIVGIIWRPYPLPLVVLFFLALGTTARIITEEQALKGFSNGIVWVVVSSFLFARAYIKTGLGKRIALTLIARSRDNLLGLSYSLALTDLLLAPFTASNTARAGGIVFPITQGLVQQLEAQSESNLPNVGGFLLFSAFQANVLTSSMFMTAMAVNPLTVHLATQMLHLHISWGAWLLAASLPGSLCLLIVPWTIYKTYPLAHKQTLSAVAYAREQMEAQGSLTTSEKTTIAISILVAAMWATSGIHGIAPEIIALLAVCVFVILGVLNLSDIIDEKDAWSTFLWFGGILSIADTISKSTLAKGIAELLGPHLSVAHPLWVLISLCLIYFYLHYLFASITAQILTLYPVFLSTAVGAGAPPMISALCLCYMSSLYASTTFYGSGPAPIFFGTGRIDRYVWLKLGFLVSLVTLIIWLGVGFAWWRLLGYW